MVEKQVCRFNYEKKKIYEDGFCFVEKNAKISFEIGTKNALKVLNVYWLF